MKYSLLTVAAKERIDGGTRSQTVEGQLGLLPGSVKLTVEAPAAPTLGSKFISEKPYRAILNGRAELMQVLGETLDTHSKAGFYFWFWPFKHLLDHGQKLRARLSAEESKFKDQNQEPQSEASSHTANEEQHSVQGDDSRLKADQTLGAVKLRADSEKDPMASQEAGQAGQDATETLNQAIEKEMKASDVKVDDILGYIAAEHSSEAMKPTDQNEKSTRLRDELRCLVTFMDTDLKDLFSVQRDIDDGTRNLIAFDHLWQLYKPGHFVVSGRGQKRAYVVLHVTGGRTLQRYSQVAMDKDNPIDTWRLREEAEYCAKYSRISPFVIDGFYLDFDGTNFGPLPRKFTLQEFEGEVKITSLEVFPIKFDEDPKQTEKSLTKRGKKIVKLAGVAHKYYSGRTLWEEGLPKSQGQVSYPGFSFKE